MDISRAKEIVSVLAEGINPLTGEVLPSDHICNQVEIVRAFYALLNSTEHPKHKDQPINAGKPWTAEADDELRKTFEAGMHITKISKHFGRSRGAIESRLARLGLLTQD